MKHYEIIENKLVQSAQNEGEVMVTISPDDREQALIQERFCLDDYDLNSALDQDEVPRAELINGRLLLIWKMPSTAKVLETVDLQVNVVGLVTHQEQIAFVGTSGDFAFSSREFRHISDTRDVMLAFLLRTIRHFVEHLKVIKQISTELEKKITVSMENKHLLQMFNLTESLVYYVDAIEGNGAVLTKLRTLSPQLGFQPNQSEMLDDIILENTQAARQAAIYSDVLSGLMDARGTIINNNMNVLLKNLTLINIVFLPLNLIASIGGMSEWSMMTQGIDWRISYAFFFVLMVAFGWGTWVLMNKLIERNPVR